MNPTVKMVKEYTEALIIALLLALFIRSFVVQAFKIPSESMLQTLQVGDHLLVNKFIYGIKIPILNRTIIPVTEPKFQDVIVFEFPVNPSVDFIKRVIGLPGDTVELRGGELFRNGEKVDEPYLSGLPPKSGGRLSGEQVDFGPVTVPAESYFVMGDNRNNSNDSRYWGFVHRRAIVGKAWRIYWSWNKAGDADGRDYHTEWGSPVRWGRLLGLVE